MKRKEITEDKFIRKMIQIMDPSVNLNNIDTDNLFDIISNNINMFIALTITNKGLKEKLESVPNLYYELYIRVFHDECMLLDIVSDIDLIKKIQTYNNYNKNRNKSTFYRVMGGKCMIVDVICKPITDKERDEILKYSIYYIKEKKMDSISDLLRDIGVQEFNDNISLDKYLSNDERMTVLDNYNGLCLVHAELCLSSRVLYIRCFFDFFNIFIKEYPNMKYDDIKLKNTYFSIIFNGYNHSLYFLSGYISGFLIHVYRIIKYEREIIYDYFKYLDKLDDLEGGLALSPDNTTFLPTKLIIESLINMHKNITSHIEKIGLKNDKYSLKELNDHDSLYYKTIDYNRLKNKICHIALDGNNNPLKCNKYWRELLVKTNANYMKGKGTGESSHYLMKKPYCFNCKKEALKLDERFGIRFCNNECYLKTYNQLESVNLI